MESGRGSVESPSVTTGDHIHTMVSSTEGLQNDLVLDPAAANAKTMQASIMPFDSTRKQLWPKDNKGTSKSSDGEVGAFLGERRAGPARVFGGTRESVGPD